MEKDLSKVNNEPQMVEETTDSKKNTDLVAFYDGEHRWIAYQTSFKSNGREKSRIQIRCIDRSDGKIKTDPPISILPFIPEQF